MVNGSYAAVQPFYETYERMGAAVPEPAALGSAAVTASLLLSLSRRRMRR